MAKNASPVVRQLQGIFDRWWNSPGRMTAASVVARAFAIAAPLPFLYASFPVETVAFWLVVITFQSLVGAFAGIMPTVGMQMVAYARTGSSAVGGSMEDHAHDRTEGPNWGLIAEINTSMVRLFIAIAGAWIAFAGMGGTLIVWRPMTASGNVPEAAIVWSLFIAGSAFRLLAQPFAAFGMGVGEVAAVRRQEATSWMLGGIGAILTLSLVPSLILAMAALQAPILLNFIQYIRLARRKGWRASSTAGASKRVQRELWSRGWRGGIGTFAGMVTVYGNGLVFAQVGGGAQTAAYLLGLNVLGIVGQVAFSPVQAASPALAARFAERRKEEMNDIAQRVIGRSMRVFVLLVLLAPVVVACLNAVLPSPVVFPGDLLWAAMCVASIFVRHGGNHLQYYTTTNDIRLHIVNPVFLVLSLGPFLLLPTSNVMLLVLVQMAAAAVFYLPYARSLTAKHLGYGLSRDISDFGAPFAAMLGGIACLSAVALSP